MEEKITGKNVRYVKLCPLLEKEISHQHHPSPPSYICPILGRREGLSVTAQEVPNSTRELKIKEDPEDSKQLIPIALSLCHYPIYFLHNSKLLYLLCPIISFWSALTRTKLSGSLRVQNPKQCLTPCKQ